MSSLIVEVVRIKEGDITPHDNADKLEIAKIKGWQCVVGKGQFKPGDLAVFIPIDSVLPTSLVEELGLTHLKKGERVRTVKLRGIISQGLLLSNQWGFKEGDLVADKLGITKWKPKQPDYHVSRGKGRKSTPKEINPYFLKYTDIENIKNYVDVFTEEDEVVILLKVHGTNARFGWVPHIDKRSRFKKLMSRILPFLFPPPSTHEFIVGSRNVQLSTWTNRRKIYFEDNVYQIIADRYNLSEEIPKDYIIFGEIYGGAPKIQDLTYGLNNDINVVFFDVMYKNEYLSYDDFVKFCDERNLPRVPELYRGPFSMYTVLEHTNGPDPLAALHGAKQIREGVVVKSVKEGFHPRLGRKILKSISDDYLLRKDGTEFH